MKIAVVGGGPVGLFCANALAQDHHQVTVFEKKTLPVAKACGEGILYLGKELLAKYEIPVETSYPITHINFHYQKESIENQLKNLTGMGVKRQNLVQALLSKIKANEQINIVQEEFLETQSDNYDFVVWASGVNPQKMKKALSYERIGMRQHYQGRVDFSQVQVFFSSIGEAYITPISTEEFQVSLILFKNRLEKNLPFTELLNFFPALKKKFDLSNPMDDLRGFSGFGMEKKFPSTNNSTAIGDARIFWDGITGEGVSLGFYQGHVLREHLKNNQFDSATFEKALRKSTKHYKLFCRLMLFISYREWLKKVVFKLVPKVFINRLVRMSVIR